MKRSGIDVPRPPVRNCEECKHFAWNDLPLMPRKTTSFFDCVAICAKGQRPRFIQPESYCSDKPWGFRKACVYFMANNTNEGRQ